MMQPIPAGDVLFEDNHLLVLNKRSGWIVQGAQPGDLSLLEDAKRYLGSKYGKPGNVYLGVVSRLDREVSGVLPLARTSKAAARLSLQFAERRVVKVYWGLVHGNLPAPKQSLEHWLTRDEQRGKTYCHSTPKAGSQNARLSYECRASSGHDHWLEIILETGRKHQIRAQFEAIGCPIAGDRKYGSSMRFADNAIALHCRRMEFAHPTLQTIVAVEAPLPPAWHEFGERRRWSWDSPLLDG